MGFCTPPPPGAREPAMFDRRNRGWFLRMTVGSPVPRKKKFPALTLSHRKNRHLSLNLNLSLCLFHCPCRNRSHSGLDGSPKMKK